jgi:hypothetical protein
MQERLQVKKKRRKSRNKMKVTKRKRSNKMELVRITIMPKEFQPISKLQL